MNRRSFLSLMGFAATAAIVKPTYFFAPPGGWGVQGYRTIGQYADYINISDIRTATGLILHYEQQFIANLKAATPIATICDPCATGLPHLPIEYDPYFGGGL